MIVSKLINTAAAACLIAAGAVNANSNVELEPMQAHTITSEKHTAVLYYTKTDSGQYEVVTTVGSNPEEPKMITRHRVVLDEGQSYSFALDQDGMNTPAQAFQITAKSDALFVAQR